MLAGVGLSLGSMQSRTFLIPFLFVAACSTSQAPAPAAQPTTTASTPAPTPTVPSGMPDASPANACSPAAKPSEIYALSARDIFDVEDISMCAFRGKVMFIFNGASQCGNTPQYAPLQKLYVKYEAQGLAVLGFPCNQFGGQESGSGAEISGFCKKEFGITFPLFGKIEVNGPGTHPVYKWIKSQPGMSADVKWNFEKFLIGRDGKVVMRIENGTAPDAPEVLAAIEAELAKPAPKL
jgi:glutathione peroxidase